MSFHVVHLWFIELVSRSRLLRYIALHISQRCMVIVMLITTMINLYGMRYVWSDCMALQSRAISYKTRNFTLLWKAKGLTPSNSAFYITYVLSNILFGVICDLYGSRYLLIFGLVISSLLSLITPAVLMLPSWWYVIVVKLSLGVSQAACMPPFMNLISYWMLPTLSSTHVTAVFVGCSFGRMLSLWLVHYLLTNDYNCYMSFYVWGFSGLFCAFLITIFVYSTPAGHPFLSAKEKDQLQKTTESDLPRKVPWKQMASDSAVWAYLTGHVAHNWSLAVVLVNVPNYLMYIAKTSNGNGLVNILLVSHFIFSISMVTSGYACDFFIKHTHVSLMNLRASFNFVGSAIGSAIFVAVTYYAKSEFVIIISITGWMVAKGLIYSGLHANTLDMTRHYAGTMYGIGNGFGSLFCIFSDTIMFYICPDHNPKQWQGVGWLSFALCFYTGTIYAIWVEGTRKKWDIILKT